MKNSVRHKVRRVDMPPSSLLAEEPRDWYDAYEIKLDEPAEKLLPWDVCRRFLDDVPWWIRFLFTVRNAVVRVFGLKTETLGETEIRSLWEKFRTMPPEAFPVDVGCLDGKIFAAGDREIVAGADDWHLTFRGSILVRPDENELRSRVVLITVVRFRHLFGRLYFLPVKPFHKLIIRRVLKGLCSPANSD